MKYRRRVIAEAIQYNGNNINECMSFCPKLSSDRTISTISKLIILSKGDYIVKEGKSFRTYNESQFNKLYESV